MSFPTDPDNQIGLVRPRKPSTAFQLSASFAGLGQIYCGAVNRGMCHTLISGLALLIAISGLFTIGAHTLPMLMMALAVASGLCIYSAFDARKLALQTRGDYRINDCNRLPVYLAIPILTLCAAAGLAFMVKANLLEAYRLNGESMTPTIEDGQRVVARKDAFLVQDPERGDLVVFRNPSDRQVTWMKRVIALQGDEIECRNGKVYINGTEEPTPQPTEDFSPITVPENHVFVLGDNRANSLDSRQIGSVPIIALTGKVGWTL